MILWQTSFGLGKSINRAAMSSFPLHLPLPFRRLGFDPAFLCSLAPLNLNNVDRESDGRAKEPQNDRNAARLHPEIAHSPR